MFISQRSSVQVNPISHKSEEKSCAVLFHSRPTAKAIQGEGASGPRPSVAGFGARMGTLQPKLPQQPVITSWQPLSFSLLWIWLWLQSFKVLRLTNEFY